MKSLLFALAPLVLQCAALILTLFATLTAPQIARAQETPPLLASQLPQRADALPLFAPRGWVVEKTVRGDLNRDKIADAALVLVEKKPAKFASSEFEARKRALLVVLKEGKVWRRAAFNASMLLGTRDGGAMYGVMETPVNVSIARGVLLVNQDSGSREKTDITLKFRMDKRTKRVYLIGSERSDSDSLINGGRQESINYLTGKKKTTLIKGETEVETTKITRVSQKLRSLESISISERYRE